MSKKPIELFAIVWKDSHVPLTPDSFKEYWPNYGTGGGQLHGWRPPKKVYYSEGQARRGMAYIPEEIKPHVVIAKATQFEIVADGAEVAVEQAKNRAKKELSSTRARWQAFLEGRLNSRYSKKDVVSGYKKAMIEYQKVVGPLDEKEAELLQKLKSGKKVEVVVTRTVSF